MLRAWALLCPDQGGRQGGLSLPLPVPFNPGSRPLLAPTSLHFFDCKYCSMLHKFSPSSPASRTPPAPFSPGLSPPCPPLPPPPPPTDQHGGVGDLNSLSIEKHVTDSQSFSRLFFPWPATNPPVNTIRYWASFSINKDLFAGRQDYYYI